MWPLRPLAFGLLVLAGLSLTAAPPGTLLELGPVEETSFKNLSADYFAIVQRDLGARFDDFKKIGAMAVFQQMFQEHTARLVPSRRLKDASVDAHGHERI